jgi:hypothetical protein
LNTSSNKRTYNFKRYALSIEYSSNLLRKQTQMMLTGSWSWTQLSTAINHEDLPCGTFTFNYHPGLRGIAYIMDDKKTLVVKADRSLASGVDICDQNLLDPTHSIGQYSVDLTTAISAKNFKVRSYMDQFLFMNNEMYVVAYGYTSTFGTSTIQSALIKVAITLTSNTLMTTTVTNLATVYGNIDTIGVLET